MRKIALFFISCFVCLTAFAQTKSVYDVNETGQNEKGNRLYEVVFGGVLDGDGIIDVEAYHDGKTIDRYMDMTNSALVIKVKAGSTIGITSVDGGDQSLHSYFYIDAQGNGFDAGIGADGYTPTGDLVAYTSLFSEAKNNWYNHLGQNVGEATGVLMNNITVPALAEGRYRARIKFDYNSIIPNDINDNKQGVIIDFNIQIVTQAAQVKYNYYYGDILLGSSTHNTTLGASYPAPVSEPRFGFTPESTSVGGTVDAVNVTKNIACKETSTFPFVYNNADACYLIQINGKYIKDNGNGYTMESDIDVTNADSYTWNFEGSRAAGFQIVNKASGEAFLLSSITSWVVTMSDAGNYNLKASSAEKYISYDGTALAASAKITSNNESVTFTKRAVSSSYPEGYYRIGYNYGAGVGMQYVQAQNYNGGLLMSSDANDASVFYYNGVNLLSYKEGKFVNNGALVEVGQQAGVVEFVNDGNNTIVAAPNQLHRYDNGNGVYYVKSCQATNHSYHYFNVEKLQSIPVRISAAEYASFYAPVAVRVPKGVVACYLDDNIDNIVVSQSIIKLTTIEEGDVIPAKFGVILNAPAGTYEFEVVEDASSLVDGSVNLFKGTVAKTEVKGDDAYILGLANGVVGLYRTETGEGKNGSFINGSHKAYLPSSALPTGAAYSAGFTFDLNGTTGIEDVVTEETEVVVFDLMGRRVDNPTSGIYIINGKKVLVK